MRNEESRLSREGDVEFGIVEGEAEIEAAIDAIFRQREARFRQLGIPVESRVADYQHFYQALLLASSNNSDASERYYLLLLKLDGQMLASLLIAEKDGIVYPLINSMTASRYSRWSPGDYLLRYLIQDACERKMKAIDFGLAEDNSYKTAWCNHRTDIYDTIHGRGAFGKTAAFVIIARTAMARRVKQSPRAFAWYQFYRSLKNDGFRNHDWKHNFQRLFRATNG
jgi:CelD/BcsL family acetyltransferase involved in cellulose biosynthesis